MYSNAGVGGDTIERPCSDTLQCNCSYAKDYYNDPLNLTCMGQNCNWYYNACSTTELIKENSSFLELGGEFNARNYGIYFVIQSDHDNLCRYLVKPLQGTQLTI